MNNVNKNLEKSKKKGAAMLVTTIVVIATALALAISVEYLGIGEMVISLGDTQSEQALETAQSCVNDALLKIRNNNNYAGTYSQNIGSGSCVITVTVNGTSRTISSIATVSATVRKILVGASILGTPPSVTITSWSEDIT